MKSIQKYNLIALAILLLGLGLRIIYLNKSIFLDEFASIHIATSGSYLQSLKNNDYPPTYFFVLKLWSRISESIPFLRLLSVIFGMLTVLLLLAWLKPFSPSASLIAGFLCATSPTLIDYSQQIQTYALLVFLVTLSFYFAYKISNNFRDVRYLIGLTAILTLTVTTHMIGIFVVPSVCFYLLPSIWSNKKDKEYWQRILLVILLPTIVFLLSFFYFAGGGKESWWMPPVTLTLLRQKFKALFSISFLFSPVSQLSKIYPVLAIFLSRAIKLMLIGVGFCLTFGNWRKNWIYLGTAIIYWLQVILFSFMILPIFHEKTLLPGVIPLIAFVGFQLSSCKLNIVKIFNKIIIIVGKILSVSLEKWQPSGLTKKYSTKINRLAEYILQTVLLFTVLIVIVTDIGWVSTGAGVPKEQWKELTRYLQQDYKTNDIVAFYPAFAEGPARYYFPELPSSKLISIEYGTTITEFNSELSQIINMTQNADKALGLFLVYEPSRSAEQDKANYTKILEYLEPYTNPYFTERDFNGLLINKYILPWNLPKN